MLITCQRRAASRIRPFAEIVECGEPTPVSTDGGFSRGQPTTLVRDVGSAAPYSSAARDHSRILIRARPDAAKDKGEIRLLFGWQEGLRQGKY